MKSSSPQVTSTKIEKRNSKSGPTTSIANRAAHPSEKVLSPLCHGAAPSTACGGHKFREQALSDSIAKHPLRVPLHAHHPIAVAGPLNSFDGAIVRMSRDAQALARLRYRLVMRAVDFAL